MTDRLKISQDLGQTAFDDADMPHREKISQALGQVATDCIIDWPHYLKISQSLVQVAYDPSPIAIILFDGMVSELEITRSSATIKLKDLRELLNVKWPKYVYGAGCVWQLYGNGCGANRVAFTVSGNVTGTPTSRVIPTDLAQANNWFDLGVIKFTSGNCVFEERTIKSYSGNTVALVVPLLGTPVANDTFEIYPGCDHTKAVCTNNFNNANNRRGFEFIPVPEAGV